MPFCRQCGKEIPDATKFCPFCGFDQTARTDLTSGPESITSKEMDEVRKIQSYLEPDEQILLVTRQSRIRPGGSIVTPNIIFATDRKLLIRNPVALGLRESVGVIPYGDMTAVHLEKGVFSSEVGISAPGLTTELGRFFRLSRHGIAGIPAIPKEDAEKLVNIVKEGMKRAKAARAVPQFAVTPSPLEELKRLKELLDMGAITKEEYEEKRKGFLRESRKDSAKGSLIWIPPSTKGLHA